MEIQKVEWSENGYIVHSDEGIKYVSKYNYAEAENIENWMKLSGNTCIKVDELDIARKEQLKIISKEVDDALESSTVTVPDVGVCDSGRKYLKNAEVLYKYVTDKIMFKLADNTDKQITKKQLAKVISYIEQQGLIAYIVKWQLEEKINSSYDLNEIRNIHFTMPDVTVETLKLLTGE